jgi:hypothetical protein
VRLLHGLAGWGSGYDILEILDALFPGFAFFDVAGDPFAASGVGSVELVELEYESRHFPWWPAPGRARCCVLAARA